MSFSNQLFYKQNNKNLDHDSADLTQAIKQRLDRQRQWSAFVRRIRSFFADQGFEECLTPIFVSSPGTEPSIDVFEIQITKGNQREKNYLRTSPEISIKKLICAGMQDCFEIAQVFRDREWTDHHRPEFTMLEWYRTHRDLSQIELDVKKLISFLCPQQNIQFQTHTIAELFVQKVNLEITPETTLSEYKGFCLQLGLDHQSMTTIDDYFFLIWTERIEPTFAPDEVIFVKDYPPFQKAYSQLHPKTGWAQRMEFYWKGFELGNAFYEETDPMQQQQQFAEDNRKKQKMGKPPVDIDQELLQLMPGMPECAGIAVGLDRLFLCIQ